MPICPKCSLGLPPTLTTCPDCGRGVVEIVSVADAEETESCFVTTAGESDPVEEDADAVSVPILPEVDDLPPVNDLQEPSHEDTVPDLPDPAEPEVIEDVAEAQEDTDDADDPPQEEGLPDLPDEPEDNDEDELEQFLAGVKRFTRIVTLDDSIQGASVLDSTEPRAKPVRWTHRAYRGDVDVINAKSWRAVTLAVFGDGLLLVESSSGMIGSLVPALTGMRQARKVVSRAGSSAEAAARLTGSRRIATPDIHSVRIAKGHGWARELTIRTTQGEELQYRFASKRYSHVVSLLSAVLGSKLRDLRKDEKAPRRAG